MGVWYPMSPTVLARFFPDDRSRRFPHLGLSLRHQSGVQSQRLAPSLACATSRPASTRGRESEQPVTSRVPTWSIATTMPAASGKSWQRSR